MTHRLTVCVDVPDGLAAEAVWVAIECLLSDGKAVLDLETAQIVNYDDCIEGVEDEPSQTDLEYANSHPKVSS